jgi:hypothetical protein
VPCTPADVIARCVELIVQATPEPDPLQQALSAARIDDGEVLHYAAVTSTRLIVDPLTLRPYRRETHRYWYVTLGRQTPREVLMHSDRSVISYAAP